MIGMGFALLLFGNVRIVGSTMISKTMSALGAFALAALGTVSANATPVNNITGNFSITATNDDSQNNGTILSVETGGRRSNFTESSVTTSVPNNHTQTDTLTGSFTESIFLGGLYGFVEFFDFQSDEIRSSRSSALDLVFSNLSDGSAESTCTSSCTLSTTVNRNDSHFTLSPETITVTFVDGASLAINVIDDEDNTDIPGKIKLSYTGPTQPVPEPATMAILGSALVGFGVMRRRRKA